MRRSKGEASLTLVTDNPERIKKEKPRKKSKNMADPVNQQATKHPNTWEESDTPNPQNNEDDTQNMDPVNEMYLPDLNNTPLSQALKNSLDNGIEDEVMVEWPKLKQDFGVDTFLVQRISGWIRLYTHNETETFPINCSRTKFNPSLLEKALKGARKQRATPKDLPGEDWPRKIKAVLSRMELDKRLDAYAELVSRYARNSVSLEHAHIVCRGTDSGYLEVAKLELRARKIANMMDEIITIMMQDNAYRPHGHFQTYPTLQKNPVNQMISSPTEADNIGEAAQQEAEEIMNIAYPSGPQPPTAITNAFATHLGHTTPPTAAPATTVTTTANCLDHGRTNRPASPSFTMNAATENHPGSTTNPLLTVNTGNDGNTNSFISQTLASNRQNRADNRNTIAFDNIPDANKWINMRLTEIANQGPTENTAINCRDCLIPDRHQFTNDGEHQYQGTYTSQNRSFNNNNNRYYNHTWESHTDRTCNNCGIKGHIAKFCPKQNFWCQWCHTATHDTACRFKPRSSTPMESPSTGSYHPTQSPNQHNTSGHPAVPSHITQPSPAPSGGEEWAKLLVTWMEEQEYNNREIENRKDYLENIEVYEGTDKQKCLPWVN